jgi:hypothetical protein
MSATKFAIPTPPCLRDHRAARRPDPVSDFDTAARVVRFVCAKFAVTPEEFDSESYRPSLRLARKIAAWLMHRYTSYSLETISMLMNRSPRAIREALASLEEMVQSSCRAGREVVALDCAFREAELARETVGLHRRHARRRHRHQTEVQP